MIKPDYEIEEFWYGLKNSMNNFYTNKTLKRPISKWSDYLNEFQKKEKYEDIEKNIRNYISLYGIDVIRHMEIYHLSILKTNIKRWNNISQKYGFIKKDTKKYYNIIFFLIDIYEKLDEKLLNNDLIEFVSQIELLIIYEDFSNLVDLCIKYKLVSILDKLSNYINLIELINNKYNLNIKFNTSGRKILKIINHLV
jgi:hypothetical protein